MQHARATATYNVFYGTAAVHTTSADASRTRACSTSPTARIAAPARSRAIRHSARGRGGSRGRCSACRAARVPGDADGGGQRAPPASLKPSRRSSMRRVPRATSISTSPRARMACPTGTPARRDCSALGDWGSRPSDPFNDREPVDSSAAAIGAQGLLRLGRFLDAQRGDRWHSLHSGRPARRWTRCSTTAVRT